MKTIFLIMILQNINPVQNFVRIDIGANSKGKTPTQIFDATAYQKIYPDKKYIVVNEGQDKWMNAHKRGQFRVDYVINSNLNPNWAESLMEFIELTPGNKIYKYKDSVVIIDDMTLTLTPQTQKAFKGLFALRPSEKFNMVMYLNGHELDNIPEGMKTYITVYHIYANECDRDQFKYKAPMCYKELMRASLVINEYERLYPGWYDEETHTPHFPHIVVYKEEPTPEMYKLGLRKINCVNMDFEKAAPIFKMFETA